MPNHDDDGTLNATVNTRLVTGLLVPGTAANPVIYVGSSDPRIGGGEGRAERPQPGHELGHHLQAHQDRLELGEARPRPRTAALRGEPRGQRPRPQRRRQHALRRQGGNTNKGAPSNNFARLPEYALSAAILSIDLHAIGSTTYDLPTLDDREPAGHGRRERPVRRQRRQEPGALVPGGPVQVFAPGFRNPYDLVITESGQMFTIDNGGNAGWGDMPPPDGAGGHVHERLQRAGHVDRDALHRDHRRGLLRRPPEPDARQHVQHVQRPTPHRRSAANPIECDYRHRGRPTGRERRRSAGHVRQLDQRPRRVHGHELRRRHGGRPDRGRPRPQQHLPDPARPRTARRRRVDARVQRGRRRRPARRDRAGRRGPVPGDDLVRRHLRAATSTCSSPPTSAAARPSATWASRTPTGTASPTATSRPTAPTRARPRTRRPTPTATTSPTARIPNDDNDALADTNDPFARDANNGLTRRSRSTSSGRTTARAGGLLNLGFTGLMQTAGVELPRPVRPDEDDHRRRGRGRDRRRGSGRRRVRGHQLSAVRVPGRLQRPPGGRAVHRPHADHGAVRAASRRRTTRRWGCSSAPATRTTTSRSRPRTSTVRRSRCCPSSTTTRSFDLGDRAAHHARAQRRRPLPPRRPRREHGPAQLHLHDRRDDEPAHQRRRPDPGAGRLVHHSSRGLAAGIISTSNGGNGPFPASWDFLQVTAENPPPPPDPDPGPTRALAPVRPQPCPGADEMSFALKSQRLGRVLQARLRDPARMSGGVQRRRPVGRSAGSLRASTASDGAPRASPAGRRAARRRASRCSCCASPGRPCAGCAVSAAWP